MFAGPDGGGVEGRAVAIVVVQQTKTD